MTGSANDDILLATGWPISIVEAALADRTKKNDLTSFLRDRYCERFFKPIKLMKDTEGNDQGYGFSIMALCSLLIESLQSYRHGWPCTNKTELERLNCRHIPAEFEVPTSERPAKLGDEFSSFFKDVEWADLFPGVDGSQFYNNIRNGLLHQAQTKDGWRVRKCEQKLWDSDRKVLDRDRFADALKEAWDRYLDKLRTEDWDTDDWKRVRRKIWWLIELSRSR
ncbi:MAG: hypothetical protein ABSE79_00185 [Terriglobia bacterium]|jgi:hypothetical protein